MGRFWPSFALACLNGGSTASIARDSTVAAPVTGDGGDDDLRLTMMDNDLVTTFYSDFSENIDRLSSEKYNSAFIKRSSILEQLP